MDKIKEFNLSFNYNLCYNMENEILWRKYKCQNTIQVLKWIKIMN